MIQTLDSIGCSEPTVVPELSHSMVAKYSAKGGITSSVEERALKLLGAGITQEQVAGALGVTAGRITQLLSDPEFSAEVTRLRCATLQSHTARDGTYDSLEDKLLVKLEKALPMLIRPADILKAITVVNGAKRRGVDAVPTSAANVNVVNLMLPTSIVQKFAVNVNNQVIQAGDQNLLTMTSSDLLKSVKKSSDAAAEAAKLTVLDI